MVCHECVIFECRQVHMNMFSVEIGANLLVGVKQGLIANISGSYLTSLTRNLISCKYDG